MCGVWLYWPPVWWAQYLAGLATASALAWSGLGPQRLRTPLLQLHVATLRTRGDAGKRLPYAMRLPRLRLVKPG